MSLSRPAKFPLMKLPYLCIKAVIKSWDILDIIFFTLITRRTRQIVKNLKIPLNQIKIILSDLKWIRLGTSFKIWLFRNGSETESSLDERVYSSKYSLVLQKNAIPLYTRKTDSYLESYCNENEFIALKMAMGFLTEVFKCSVEDIETYEDNFPESGDIGVKSTVNLYLRDHTLRPLSSAQSHKLNLLLENLEVTGTCSLHVNNTEEGFYLDPERLKCRKLVFWPGSTAWVTRDILLQFDVPRLRFNEWAFFVKDLVLFVNNWFHSENKKLEYLHMECDYLLHTHCSQVSLKTFQTEELNPVRFSERTRVPLTESFKDIDFSKGLEIVRHDGLQGTIHVNRGVFLFYIWHN